MTGALAPLVEIHRARSCAEGMGRCSNLAAGGVQVLVECREEAGWELVVDRAHLAETWVERKGFVGWFEDPFFGCNGGGEFESGQVVIYCVGVCKDALRHGVFIFFCSLESEEASYHGGYGSRRKGGVDREGKVR